MIALAYAPVRDFLLADFFAVPAVGAVAFAFAAVSFFELLAILRDFGGQRVF